MINEEGGFDSDVNVRIGKTTTAFLQLKKVWNPKQLSVSQHQSPNVQHERQDSSIDTRTRIDTLIQEVASLKDVEKLLFCLLLPVDNTHGSHCISNTSFGFAGDELEVSSGYDVNSLGIGLFSPGGQSSLHLSNQVEQSQAYTWIMSHLEEDPSTCLRKDEVYDDYRYLQRLVYSLAMSIGSMFFRC
ncbi:unnamed protein product [Schistosoma mattheei]|uniref:Uncharacterized protein n=1 Tax=Schistosoma mattheei TaxID=31246 RepID=A0A183P3P6_9TREM|nr:unnamed protein product [Schistosoma mattheei]